MNLGEFKTLVSQTINRGTTLDGRIPLRVQMAVQWLERNYTFKYMESFRLLQIIANQRTVKIPTNVVIKAFRFVRLIESDGSYTYLNKVEPQDILGLGQPSTSTTSQVIESAVRRESVLAFWMAGLDLMVLNAVPAVDMVGEGQWYQYSDWPTEDDARHPLFDVAIDVLLSQTLLFIAAFDMRDARMVASWKEIRDEGINTLTRSEDETKYGGEGISMAFVPEPGSGLVKQSRN